MSHEHPSNSQGPNPLIVPEAIAKIWRDQILEMVNSKVKIRQPEVAPKVTSKGMQHQLNFNVRILNLVMDAQERNSENEELKKIEEEIRKRNQEIVLIDKSPETAGLLEKAAAMAAITSNCQIDPAQMVMMAQLCSQDMRKRKHEDSQPWFRQTGVARGQSGVCDNRAQFRRLGERGQQVVCYRCNQRGHYASECRQSK
uniref:CCHC-type domain-containing protein n=1 Tax=Caenorhabditis japonica TaxID=281687 RepID=A0A8R1ISE1_CAEJA